VSIDESGMALRRLYLKVLAFSKAKAEALSPT
jgi:hypothetical protein